MASLVPDDFDPEEMASLRYVQETLSDDEGVTITEPSVRDTLLRGEVLTHLHDALASMFKEEELTDLQVKVEGKVFKCHQVIMAAMSGYFRSLLTSGMQESQNGEVELQDVSKRTFELLLLYMYYGENVVSSESVEDILKAAVLLQIKPLEKACVEYMSKSLNSSNCMGIWKAGKTFGCPALVDTAWAVILRNFEEVSHQEDFLALDMDDVVAILDDDQLNSSSEDPICDAVISWIQSDLSEREEHMEDLLSLVCVPKMSSSFVYDRLLLDHDLMQKNTCFFKFVMEATRCHMKPDEKSKVMAKQTKLRNDPNYRKVEALVGGYFMTDDPLKCVLCYDLNRRKWYTVASMPQEPGEDFAVCTYQNEMYVSGGSRSLNTFIKYVPGNNDWLDQPSLITGRECHSMVVVGENVYILGGRNSQMEEDSGIVKDIEAYNTTRGTWSKVGKLEIPLDSLSAAVMNEKIYTFGGTDEDGQSSSAIQCFDPSNTKCSLVASLPESTSATSAIAFNSNIYVLTQEGMVFRFDPTQSLSKVAEFEGRSKFGLYVDGHSLMVVGGQDENGTFLDKILKVNVKSGSVADADTKLPIPFCGFKMESLVLPKVMLAQEGFNVQGQNLFDRELELREQYKAEQYKAKTRRHPFLQNEF
ncbi:kelch-like protein 24 [Haliotis rubra]|uniref:kelch-like protein 24 n=1 Tax=Haliotis rubra TaxID=36100 RepID=UPI001EE54158|nr:kelch-like protein 24 [Haliotis rubra]